MIIFGRYYRLVHKIEAFTSVHDICTDRIKKLDTSCVLFLMFVMVYNKSAMIDILGYIKSIFSTCIYGMLIKSKVLNNDYTTCNTYRNSCAGNVERSLKLLTHPRIQTPYFIKRQRTCYSYKTRSITSVYLAITLYKIRKKICLCS